MTITHIFFFSFEFDNNAQRLNPVTRTLQQAIWPHRLVSAQKVPILQDNKLKKAPIDDELKKTPNDDKLSQKSPVTPLNY